MKKMVKVVSIFLCVVLVLLMGVGCGTQKEELVKVRLAVHSNEGAALTAIALKEGILEKHGIDVELSIVDSGVSEVAAMRANNRTLDIGYIGTGVAWNAIDPTGNTISFVFVDYIGKSEQLLAKDGIFKDANNNGKFEASEIVDTLKGQEVYMEVGATPGLWFKNLLNVLNEGKADADKLWMDCEVSSYLAGYKAPNTNPANKVSVVNYSNANIAAGMSTTDASAVKIAVAFSPVTTTILKSNKTIKAIADSSIMPADKVNLGTWIASDAWIKEDPKTVQKVIDALYEGACYRTEHLEDSMREAEKLCQKPADSFSAGIVQSISKAQYKEWFANSNSQGYVYVKALYENSKGSIPKGATPKSFEESFNKTFLLKSIETIK